jgi:hypothetical protein
MNLAIGKAVGNTAGAMGKAVGKGVGKSAGNIGGMAKGLGMAVGGTAKAGNKLKGNLGKAGGTVGKGLFGNLGKAAGTVGRGIGNWIDTGLGVAIGQPLENLDTLIGKIGKKLGDMGGTDHGIDTGSADLGSDLGGGSRLPGNRYSPYPPNPNQFTGHYPGDQESIYKQEHQYRGE